MALVNTQLEEKLDLSKRLCQKRYPKAQAVLLAGSFVRGAQTQFSDLDLIVIYNSVSNAYRESFTFENMPIEAFVHDPETLTYFFNQVDRPSGIPSLMAMVLEGIVVSDEFNVVSKLKKEAQYQMDLGPPALSLEADKKIRYFIADLADDIRDGRSFEESIAVGTKLYQVLANYYLRINGFWSASGKSIPRAIKQCDEAFADDFQNAFHRLFHHGDCSKVVEISDKLIGDHGGFVFEGYRSDAPSDWR